MRDATLLIARLLLAAALLPPGIARALNIPGFALALAGGGLPSPSLAATGLVVLNIFGPLALALGLAPRLTGYALAALGGVLAVALHRFWEFSGALRATEQAVFLAEIGLAAGFLLYAAAGPGAWSLQGRWRGLVGGTAGKPTPQRRAPLRPKAA